MSGHYDALAFCGGGGKGAYQLGVWRALEELGETADICSVAGTSIGALNAVLFALGDFKKAEKLWASVKPEDVLSPQERSSAGETLLRDVKSVFFSGRTLEQMRNGMGDVLGDLYTVFHTLSIRGMFSRDGLQRILEQIDLDRLSRSPVEVFVTTRNEQTGLPDYHRLNDLPLEEKKRLLRATSALPFIYPGEHVKGRTYRDGGWNPDGNNPGGNMPVMPLYGAGRRRILISTLSSPGLSDRKNFDRELENLRIRLGAGVELRALYPQSDLGGLLGMLNFERTFLDDLTERGYQETLAALQPAGNGGA